MTRLCQQFAFVLAAATIVATGLGCERGRHVEGEAQQSPGTGATAHLQRPSTATIQLASGEVESPDGASSTDSNQFAGDPFHASMQG